MILTFSSTTVIDSSSTTNCNYDRAGRCYVPQEFDLARFFSTPVQEFENDSVSSSHSLGGYFIKNVVDIADQYCSQPYDILFPQCLVWPFD